MSAEPGRKVSGNRLRFRLVFIHNSVSQWNHPLVKLFILACVSGVRLSLLSLFFWHGFHGLRGFGFLLWAEDGQQRTDNRGRTTEDGQQRTEDRGQKVEQADDLMNG